MNNELYQCYHCERKLIDDEIYDSINDTWFICEDCYVYHSNEWDHNKKENES